MKLCLCLTALTLFCLASADSDHIIQTFDVPSNPKHVDDFVFKGRESISKGKKLQITSGRQAGNTQFPYVAELSINTATGGWLCTGSLIAPNWVMTARHCIADIPATSIRASFGSADRQAVRTQLLVVYATWLNAADGINHPDIALFRLEANLVSTTAIKPIRLPRISYENYGYDGYEFAAIGWGQTSPGVLSRYLQYTYFKIIPQTSCYLGQYILCSQPPTGTSQLLGGDSGGPGVIVEADGIETQIGVNVAYANIGTAVYQETTRVSSFLRWIQATTGVIYY